MREYWPLIAGAPLGAFFYAIASRRARNYGCIMRPFCISAILPGALALGLLAWTSCRATATGSEVVLLACATASTISDLQTGLVFDAVLAAGMSFLVPAAALTDCTGSALLGASLAGGLLLLPYLGSRGRALGLGDVKLAALIGFALGPAGAFGAVRCAAIAGGGVALWLLVVKRAGRATTLPFAPFLTIGASWIVLGR